MSKNEQLIFYVAVPIALFALLDLLVFGPVLKKISIVKHSIAEKEVMIENDLKVLSYEENIVAANERLERFVAQEDLENDVINGNFLSKVEQLANQAKMVSFKTNPGEFNVIDGYTEYYTDIDCEGELSDVLGFIYKINTLESDLLKVVRLNVRPKRGGSDEVTASMTIVKMVINSSVGVL